MIDCRADSSAIAAAGHHWRCHRHFACADRVEAKTASEISAATRLPRHLHHFDAAQSPELRQRWRAAALASFAAAAVVVASSSVFARHSRPTWVAAAEPVAVAARKLPLLPSAPRYDAADAHAAVEEETRAGKSDSLVGHTHHRHCFAAGIVAAEAPHKVSGYCRKLRCRCRCFVVACTERAATYTGRARLHTALATFAWVADVGADADAAGEDDVAAVVGKDHD